MQAVRKLQLHYRMLTKPAVVSNGGLKLRVSPDLHPSIVRGLYKNGFERKEIRLLKETLREGDIVLDAGAGIGQSAIAAAKITKRKVFAVEANPNLIPVIRENAALNNVEIEVIHGAVGVENGSASFYVEHNFSASSLMPSATAKKMPVPVIGIRALIETINPTYLNIDIEGAEFDVLPLISKKDVSRISAEVHDETKTEHLVKTMEANGFKCRFCGNLLLHLF